MEEPKQMLADKIRQFIEERLATKLEAFDKATEKKRKSALEEQLSEVEADIQTERTELLDKFKVDNWLTDAAKRAGQISMVTHAAKYTHSDTKSVSIYLPPNTEKSELDQRYLTSSSLVELVVDTTGNAAALDVAGLLKQDVDGKTLLDELIAGDDTTLTALATNPEQVEQWREGLKACLTSKALTSGQLSKQLYFPVEEDGNAYHLISPLYASSFSQAVYNKLTASFYSDKAKAIRQAKRSDKYHPEAQVAFPNIATQSFGGTKPQNISQLNTSRYGKGYLLSSQPPVWQQQAFIPAKGKYAFWREFDRRVWKKSKALRHYLEKVFPRTSIKEIRDQRAEFIDELMDECLLLAAEVQNQQEKAGWSAQSDLIDSERLWLDLYRTLIDEEFREEREKNDWQIDIANGFASWLNNVIGYNSDALFPGENEHGEWQRLLKRRLVRLKDDLEVMA